MVTGAQELKSLFQPRGLLLTAAVSAGKKTIDTAYDVPEVSKYLDFINVMCYDYHGGWETVAGHHAPLYARPDDNEENRMLNVNFSINYWLAMGAPRDKLVLGMGLYGRSFTLQRAEDNGVGASAPQRGRAGPYTREPGSLGYNEICEEQSRGQPWTQVRDPYFMAPYAFRERQWVGYDDIESIMLKVEYAKHMGLAGGMVWSVETDDFQGSCHGERYPLLTAINRAFARPLGEMPLPPPSDGSTPPAPPTSTTGSTTTTTTGWWTRPTTISSTSWWTRWTSPSTTSWTSPSTTSWTRPSTPSWTQPSTTTEEGLPPWATTSPPEDRPQCKSSGLHRHPTDCQKFYSCVQDHNVEGGFRLFEFSCPDNTVFDPRTRTCSFPRSVEDCKDYYLRKYAFLRHYYI
ncbi:Cht9 [Cordylochernes scorpioides]|uniref:Cht9 n=1 Tax=Cordylochernes scorpioides TaxID=51811 RepID=A0ABY6K6F2_9ARAC|nr:Cht9 [Cordylochernes scorpioides]